MNIRELYKSIESDANLNSISKDIMYQLLNRNLSPMRLPQIYGRKAVERDELSINYAALLDGVKHYLESTPQIDFTLPKKDEYDELAHILFFCSKNDKYDLELVCRWFAELLINKHSPTIDSYVEKLSSSSPTVELNLNIDDEMLVDITQPKYELKKHGLIIDKKLLVYPHQFLRRFYSANFVNILSMLSYCKEKGCNLKIRLDPIRGVSDSMRVGAADRAPRL